MEKVRKIVLISIILTLLSMISTLFLTESMAEDTLSLNTTTEEKNYDRGATSTWQATTPTPSAQSTTAPTAKPANTTQSIPAAGTGKTVIVIALVGIGIAIAVIFYKKDKYMNL